MPICNRLAAVFVIALTMSGDTCALCAPSVGSSGSANSTAGSSYTVDGQTADENTYEAAQAVNTGLSLLAGNQLQAARQKFQSAVQLNAAMPEAHHNLGYVLSKLGLNSEAICEYKHAMDLGDKSESVWLSLAGLYQSTGQFDLAIQTLQGFVEHFPSSDQYHKIESLLRGLQSERQRQLTLTDNKSNTDNTSTSTSYYSAATSSGVTARWSSGSMPLTVHISGGLNVPFFRPEYSTLLQEAFTDWGSCSQGILSFVFVNSPDADIQCSWTSNPSSVSNAAEAGETIITIEEGFIIKANIKMLTVPLSAELPLTQNRMRAFCLHEAGHALGIEGHSTYPTDIMYSSAVLSDNPRDISVRDRNTLLRLYTQSQTQFPL